MVALFALVIAAWAWRSAIIAVLAELAAAAAFTFASYVSGSYLLTIVRGELHAHAAILGPKWAVHPSPAPPFFAIVAIAGVVSTLTLAVRLMRSSGA